MASILDLHDAEILGIAFDRAASLLTLTLRRDDGRAATLGFSGTLGWDLSPFTEQNVMFELRMYDSQKPPKHLADELPPGYQDVIAAGSHRCYEIDASVGMGGYVIAADAALV